MKLFGRSTISEFLGDRIAYRNLNSLDTRLPSLKELRASLRLPEQGVPRKTSLEYANIVSHLLRRARTLEAYDTTLNRLIFVGDTRLNDATAFTNLCAAGNWPGAAFICAEKPHEPPYQEIIQERGNRLLFLANRWELLREFDAYLDKHEFAIDERTAVILDLDKTCLGARGRNDQVINQARVEAAFTTVKELIGDEFDPKAFEESYLLFNETEFHPFTTDNQDYLVYLCLVVSAGLYNRDQLADDILKGSFFRFDQFLSDVQAKASQLPAGVRSIHQNVYSRVQSGDPTPFKTFRVNEYRATVARMGQLEDEASLETRLSQEIVITQEVRARASDWRFRGALLFGLSDKPDEASVPTDELARQGFLPIHQVETHVVGAEGN